MALCKDACANYYIKQAGSGLSSRELPVFVGSGSQRGNGWFSDIWTRFLYPHVLSPLLRNYVVPKVKSALSENIGPNLRRGLGNFKDDINSGSSAKSAFKKRAKETLKRIAAKQLHGGGKKRRKRVTRR